MVTLEDVKQDAEVDSYLRAGNEHLGAIGFTDHSYRHVSLVSGLCGYILQELEFPGRMVELGGIAGYLHDVGNVVSRQDHGQTGAVLCHSILSRLGMPPQEIAVIMGAVGNHEEQYGQAVNPVAAALILADKSDVNRARVRNTDISTFDIHDRVNYAVQNSSLRVDSRERTVLMELTIDLTISTVMEYFEIFLTRMVMSRRAADFLKCQFELIINDSRLL